MNLGEESKFEIVLLRTNRTDNRKKIATQSDYFFSFFSFGVFSYQVFLVTL